jgi:hypothetical protein
MIRRLGGGFAWVEGANVSHHFKVNLEVPSDEYVDIGNFLVHGSIMGLAARNNIFRNVNKDGKLTC